ncbi:MAG: hypothetical protein QF707_00300 [Candidatus Poseidoniaceae archaeon]|jgi:hypothetical protein|nr:hypothetical protein [Candidatus Poseidoniaceae archaeon]|tara:strand:- start:251 stop:613 length:363 start_codon:yes stop_codon:yes gene_type:complete
MRQPLLFVAILIFSTSGLSGILVEEPISVPIDSIHEAIISMTVDWDVDSDGDGVPDVNESGEDESTSTDWNKAVAEELGDTSYKTDEYGTEWWQDEIGVHWYREKGHSSWSKWEESMRKI